MSAQPATSALTRVEIQAAVEWRHRERKISDSERRQTLELVDRELMLLLAVLPLDDFILAEARRIVTRFPVRSLDAVHLATAWVASRYAKRHRSALHFCTADRRQASAAESMFGSDRVIFVPPLS